MPLLRVDARPLLPLLRAQLVALLTGLAGDDWARPTACPGWTVPGVAALTWQGDDELAAALAGVKAVLG